MSTYSTENLALLILHSQTSPPSSEGFLDLKDSIFGGIEEFCWCKFSSNPLLFIWLFSDFLLIFEGLKISL